MARTIPQAVFSLLLPGLLVVAGPAAAQQLKDATAVRFPSPAPLEYTNQVAAGDLDNDLDLDLVFANGGNFSMPGTPQLQRIYINDGHGVFSDQSASRLGGFTGLCRGVALGDIDNDGDLDIAFAQDFLRQPALFRNNGAGVFTDVTAAQLPVAALSSSRGLFADIDNDGDLDLYFVNGGASRFGCGQFRVYVNNGAGFYTDETATRTPVDNVCQTLDAAFGDIDGDFDLDLRTAAYGLNNGRLYRNDGPGVFSALAPYPHEQNAWSYEFGDIDRNGTLDLVGADAEEGSAAEIVLRNLDGNGNFTWAGALQPPAITLQDNDSKFFDYDNDGDLDLIMAQVGGSGERVYENDGAGNFEEMPGVIDQVSDSTMDVLVADLNRDARLDVVTAQGESGSLVNRIYISSGAMDTRPPRVIATESLPDTKDTKGPYVVRAAILDDLTSYLNFYAQAVDLRYTVNGGEIHRVPMRFSGGQIYRGEIPGQAAGTVEYLVEAYDFNGYEGFGTKQTFEVGSQFLFADGFESGDTSAWSN